MASRIYGPSLKAMRGAFKNHAITLNQLKLIKSCMVGKCNSEKIIKAMVYTGKCSYQTGNYLLTRVNRILWLFDYFSCGYGVECIRSKQDTMHNFAGIEYVNHGDTYAATLIYDYSTGNFRACSYGDILESARARRRFE